jgi:hypothetical protein
VSGRLGHRRWLEPASLFTIALVGSAGIWGRLWVTSPTSRGVCGCGDPALFQWFLAWPAHALATAHSLVFSTDLFHPAGINLLANTSVLALGVPLAPVTWLGGPVLSENVAALLAIPVAALTMDLLLRRVARWMPGRAALSLLYAFSPFVVGSLAISHFMTGWVGVLPLIALGAFDLLGDDERRARRGAVLLVGSVVFQFFLGTELLFLTGLTALVVAVVVGATWLAARGVPAQAAARLRRLLVPAAVLVVLLAAPAAYALWGPRSLRGHIWGTELNTNNGGTTIAQLLVPHAVSGGLTQLSGYSGAGLVQIQYLGVGLVAVAAAFAVWRWRDAVSRAAAVTALVCILLSLTSHHLPWAPWRFIGRLPLAENVVQFRIVVFALLAACVIIARGLDDLAATKPSGVWLGAAALAVAIVPVAVPVASTLPLRTGPIAVPAWWREPPSSGVVVAYPYPGVLLQGPLAWQASSGFGVSMLGGSGPQGSIARSGPDATATSILDALSTGLGGRPAASPKTAAPVRSMLVRDGATQVVVPVSLHGPFLVTGAPTRPAAAFFVQVLGIAPTVERGAWVFRLHGALPPPRFVPASAARACERVTAARPDLLGSCILGLNVP